MQSEIKKILIIDTSRSDIRLVLESGGDVFENNITTEKQSAQLPSAVEQFLIANKIAFSDLTALAVVVGPGSFTGIRLGIAYAKGLSIGLQIPLVPISAFEIYLSKNPDAFVAIDSNRGDFFVSAQNLSPCVMTIDDVESKQMKYPRTIGHIRYDLKDSLPILKQKLLSKDIQPAIPLYMRPHYAELKS